MSADRFFAFFGENRASLAMDIQDTGVDLVDGLPKKELTFAVAFCNHRDDFNKKIARDILNGRLDAAADRHTRLTFKTTYVGTHPKRDVMNPLMSKLRSLSKDRDHSEVSSVLKDLFLHAQCGPEITV